MMEALSKVSVDKEKWDAMVNQSPQGSVEDRRGQKYTQDDFERNALAAGMKDAQFTLSKKYSKAANRKSLDELSSLERRK